MGGLISHPAAFGPAKVPPVISGSSGAGGQARQPTSLSRYKIYPLKPSKQTRVVMGQPKPIRPGFGFMRDQMWVGDAALDSWTQEELEVLNEGHARDPLRNP
jgi:hypothetical protein